MVPCPAMPCPASSSRAVNWMAGKLRILEKKIKTEIINVPEIINVTEIINVPDGLPATRGDHVLRRGPARHLPQTPGHREPDPGDPGQPPGQDLLVPDGGPAAPPHPEGEDLSPEHLVSGGVPADCEQPVRRRGPAQHLLHEPPRREDHDEHLRAGGDSRDEQPALQQEDAEPERQFEDSELRRLGFLSPADWRNIRVVSVGYLTIHENVWGPFDFGHFCGDDGDDDCWDD